ncbi:hypothetical protein ACWDTT_10510 [Streptosporangium sandarakinum]
MAYANRIINPSVEVSSGFSGSGTSASFNSGSVGYNSVSGDASRASISGGGWGVSTRTRTEREENQRYTDPFNYTSSFTNTRNTAYVDLDIAAEPAGTYTLSFQASAGSGPGVANFAVGWKNRAGARTELKTISGSGRLNTTVSLPDNAVAIYIQVIPRFPSSPTAYYIDKQAIGGGVTYQATPTFVDCFLDDFRLCSAAETTYADGATPGYAWTGTANASPTRATPVLADPVETNVFNYWRSPHPSGTGWSKTANATLTDNGSSLTAQLTATNSAFSSATSPTLDVTGIQANTTARLGLDVTALTYSAGAAANYNLFALTAYQYNASGVLLGHDTFDITKSVGRKVFSFPTLAGVAKMAVRIAASGDATARLLFVTIDNIRLDVRADTTYIGGETTGYMWNGQPNASYTVRGMRELTASAQIGLTGAASELVLSWPMSATAHLKITSPLVKIGKVGVTTASDTLTVTGSATLVVNGAMGARASHPITGSAPLYAIVPISADARITTDGTAHVYLVDTTVAYAHIPMQGSAKLTVMQVKPTSASATIGVTGSAVLSIGLQIGARADIAITGSADLSEAVPPGAFADFAIYGTTATDTDPLMLGRGATNAGINSGATGQPWTRVHAEFHAPADRISSGGAVTWRRAAYAAVGFTFANLPAGSWQQLTNIQVEVSATSAGPGPTPYLRPQLIRPLVVADRVNHVGPVKAWISPWFNTAAAVTQLDDGASPVLGDTALVQTFRRTADSEALIAGWITAPPPPGEAVFSLYVRLGGGVTDAKVTVNDAEWKTLGLKMATDTAADENGWRRVEVAYTQPKGLVFVTVEPVSATPRTFPEEVSITAAQCEPGAEATPYFQLVPGSRDWFYRRMGTDPTLGQFEYRDIDARTTHLMEALAEFAPMDVTVGDPEFGVLPYLE